MSNINRSSNFGATDKERPSLTTTNSAPRPLDRLIRLPTVLELTGLGKTTIYQLQKIGSFPHSISVTKFAVRWMESEVLAWIAEQSNARKANQSDISDPELPKRKCA